MRRINSVDYFLREIAKTTSIRSYFSSLLPLRDRTLGALHTIPQQTAPISSQLYPFGVIHDLEDKSCVHVARLTVNDTKLIGTYESPYLRNSIISNVFFKWAEDMKKKMDTAVFSLYYYIFLQTDELNDLTHNVCYEMEEMVKVIIKKETSLYRNYDTLEIISELRRRISSERLLNMGYTNKNINFRR